MEDRETRQERRWIVGVIASLLLLAFAVYIGLFLGEWGLALFVITTVLGAAILVYGFLN
jgi:hypothetical protein